MRDRERKALADKEIDSKGLLIHADRQDLDRKRNVERQTGSRTETETSGTVSYTHLTLPTMAVV